MVDGSFWQISVLFTCFHRNKAQYTPLIATKYQKWAKHAKWSISGGRQLLLSEIRTFHLLPTIFGTFHMFSLTKCRNHGKWSFSARFSTFHLLLPKTSSKHTLIAKKLLKVCKTCEMEHFGLQTASFV